MIISYTKQKFKYWQKKVLFLHFYSNAHSCHGDFRTVHTLCSVVDIQVVLDCHDKNQCNLRCKTGRSTLCQGEEVSTASRKSLAVQRDRGATTEGNSVYDCICHLSQNGDPGCTINAHIQSENCNGVANHIYTKPDSKPIIGYQVYRLLVPETWSPL